MKKYILLLLILLNVGVIAQNQDRSGFGYSVGLAKIETINGLLGLNVRVTPEVVFVEGLNSSGDGGGGAFRYYPDSSEATNTTTIFKPFAYDGRWKVVFGANALSSFSGTSGFDQTAFTVPVGGVSGVYFTNIYTTNMSAGVTDVFTVPASKFAYLHSVALFNPTNATVTSAFFINTGVDYKRLSTSLSIATNSIAINSIATINRMFKPGEILSVTNNLPGTSMIMIARIIPSSASFSINRLYGVTTTPQLLYQAPADKYGFGLPTLALAAGLSGQFVYSNDTGTTRKCRVYLVAPGGSPTEGNSYNWLTTVNNGAVGAISLTALPPGYSYWVASDLDTGLQSVFFDVFEFNL